MEKSERMGICKLCLKHKELQLSHAIPNTYFKHVLRSGNGNAIKMDSDPKAYIEYTNDSGKELMLCRECESHINQFYESHANDLFKKALRTKFENQLVSFGTYKPESLINFFISILWRAAHSKQEIYKCVYLPNELLEKFRLHILNRSIPASNIIAVRCSILGDAPGFEILDEEKLSYFICVPLPELNSRHVTYSFLFFGIYAELRIGGFKHKERNNCGHLLKSKKILVLPIKNIFEVPQLQRLFSLSHYKVSQNMSKIS